MITMLIFCFGRAFLLIMFLYLLWVPETQGESKVFNVMEYGAISDGKTDNSEAFLKAWREACEWEGKARVLIPWGMYKLYPVKFTGPCKGHIAFLIKGTLKATTRPDFVAESWINFRNVDGLIVGGGGTLNGQGHTSWPLNDCGRNPKCPLLPTSMRFDFVRNARIHNLRSIDSKNSHFTIFGSESLNLTKIRIYAPADSPNTDGIKIGRSHRVWISRAAISTGDDCISVLSGCSDVEISGVHCGPGHGISVGSLGKYMDEKDVRGIVVRNCTLGRTTNGLRIKTWASPFASQASDFLFQDIVMNSVLNPITIDQHYCPYDACEQETSSHVQISNVVYKNIRGSSSSEVAVALRCSLSRPCRHIMLDNINLALDKPGGTETSVCSNVNGFSYGQQNPASCL